MRLKEAPLIRRHLNILRWASISTWFLSAFLVHITTYVPAFDSSARAVFPSDRSFLQKAAQSLLRWDAFYFGHIAQSGYVYEHEWVFFPGVPLVSRWTAQLISLAGIGDVSSVAQPKWEYVLLGGAFAAYFCSGTTTLYRLTLHHMHSPSIAFLVSLLALFPSSPATLRLAGYTEPFFTYLSYRGMLFCAGSQWFFAACCFALAGTFRSNGILLSGFILWGILVEPFLKTRKISPVKLSYAIALTTLVFLPFIAHQYRAYRAFCLGPSEPVAWCSAFPPSIYTHAQSKYWNVGLFRYWTLQQLPNFLISAPVLALLLAYTTSYLVSVLPQLFSLQHVSPSPSPLMSPALAPHVIHALATTLLLLFAAHTQIILRFAAAMPTTYWAAAWLVLEHPRWGRAWVAWSVVWGAISLVLWGVFLPPA